MPLVKRTIYVDENVDRCVNYVEYLMKIRKVRRVSYSLALDMMLSADILDLATGTA